MALYVMSCLSYQLVDRLLYSFYVSTCFVVFFFVFFFLFFFFVCFFFVFFVLFCFFFFCLFFLFVCSTYFFKYKQAKINCLNGILWNLARRADGVCEASYGSP